MAKILIAEDQLELSHMMASSLKLEGHQVHQEADGLSALDNLAKNAYDMAILDFHLPYLTGLDICKELKEKGKLDKLHILVISADADPTMLTNCLAYGAEAFLNKPFSLQEFLDSVEGLLN